MTDATLNLRDQRFDNLLQLVTDDRPCHERPPRPGSPTSSPAIYINPLFVRRSKGQPPSRERLTSTPASVLLVHGRAIDAGPGWAAANDKLIAAFLGNCDPVVEHFKFGEYLVRTMTAGPRTAVLGPFLNGRMKGLQPGPRDAIGRLIQAAADA